MEIIRAKHSGFCFGVDRAINLAFTEAERKDRKGRLLCCGHLIHNSAVVARLESLGVTVIGSLSEANAGDTVIVRSHGEPREFYEDAGRRGIELIDTMRQRSSAMLLKQRSMSEKGRSQIRASRSSCVRQRFVTS